jgi:plasmid maintenance system killer protein
MYYSAQIWQSYRKYRSWTRHVERRGSRAAARTSRLPDGHWFVWVNGNWRVTFRFVGADVELVDYQDYH